MAECSQEFKDMLDGLYEEAFDDGQHYLHRSWQASNKEKSILEYVARLEASHKTMLAVYGGGTAGAAV